ncbi:MAG: hypothetical protein NTX24_03115 [Candidatus Pacearchaeota archaeon]|nr:hypothetical protein [Candidatus Pacearchaeota archaeon]
MKRGIHSRFVFLVLLFTSIILPIVSAATYNIEGGDQVISAINSFFTLSSSNWQIMILCILFFVLFFIAISKIIKDFSGFSPWIAWVLGIGISIVGAVTGMIGKIESFFYSLSFIIALAINILLFFGTYLFEWLVNRKIGKDKELKKLKEEADAEVAKEYNKVIADVISKAKG